MRCKIYLRNIPVIIFFFISILLSGLIKHLVVLFRNNKKIDFRAFKILSGYRVFRTVKVLVLENNWIVQTNNP